MARTEVERELRGTAPRRYDGGRPEPDAAYIETASTRARFSSASTARVAAGLQVIAGIWLIISPFVLGYTGADATWNPIVFGAIVGVFGLARLTGQEATVWLSYVNMAIGVWLFISAFWLASSAQASWNVGVMGVVVFVLGAFASARRP